MREHGGKHEYRAKQQYRITLSRTTLTSPQPTAVARRNVEDRWNKSVAWGTYRWSRSSEDDRVGQRGGDGDGDGDGVDVGEGRRENIIYYTRDFPN